MIQQIFVTILTHYVLIKRETVVEQFSVKAMQLFAKQSKLIL